MIVIRIAFAVLLVLVSASQIHANENLCTEYKQPTRVTQNQFLDSPFGTLGMKILKDNRWILSFSDYACYDMSAFTSRYSSYIGTGRVKFYMNTSTEHTQISYASATAISPFNIQFAGLHPFYTQYIRNGNASNANGLWIKMDNEATEKTISASTTLPGRLLTPLSPNDFSTKLVPLGGISEELSLNTINTPHEDWLSLLTSLSRRSFFQPEEQIPISANSHVGIDQLVPVHQFSRNLGNATTLKFFLTKFQATNQPSLEKHLFEFAQTDCVYFKHQVNRETLATGHARPEFLVLRYNRNSNC